MEPQHPSHGTGACDNLSEALSRFYCREPKEMGIESVDVRLTVDDAKGVGGKTRGEFPIRYFPRRPRSTTIRGHAIIGKDYVTNGGNEATRVLRMSLAWTIDGWIVNDC